MPLSAKIREDSLVNSRRCCCICHEFAGLYTNIHHIVPEASGGENTIENSIVLCLRCHGEVGHYNPKHPIGNKYSPDELARHRNEWWEFCEKNPTKSFPQKPISVSPNGFRLVSGRWKTKQKVKITNRSEDPLYDVAIKFSIRIKGIKANEIQLGQTKREMEFSHNINGIEVSADLIRLNGRDSAGYEVFVVYIHSIDPGETITLILTNNSQTTPQPSAHQHAVISLQGFSEEPSEMLIDENSAAMQFKTYEDWETSGVEILLKRTR